MRVRRVLVRFGAMGLLLLAGDEVRSGARRSVSCLTSLENEKIKESRTGNGQREQLKRKTKMPTMKKQWMMPMLKRTLKWRIWEGEVMMLVSLMRLGEVMKWKPMLMDEV